jgi:hypothetical protein
VFYKIARYSLHQVEGHLNLAKQKLQKPSGHKKRKDYSRMLLAYESNLKTIFLKPFFLKP